MCKSHLFYITNEIPKTSDSCLVRKQGRLLTVLQSFIVFCFTFDVQLSVTRRNKIKHATETQGFHVAFERKPSTCGKPGQFNLHGGPLQFERQKKLFASCNSKAAKQFGLHEFVS